MRRPVSSLVGAAVLAAAVWGAGVPEAVAAPAETHFSVAFVADEGPAPVTGTTFTFEARLVAGQDPVAGAAVTLAVRPYGASAFTKAADATTGPDGYVTAKVRLTRSSTLRWVYSGNAEYTDASTAFVRTVGSRVHAAVRDASLARSQRVVVVGRTTPLKPGTAVSLWRGSVPCFCVDNVQTRIAVGRIAKDGTFRLTAKFANPGSKQLFVKVNAGGGTTTGYSKYLRVRVR